MTEAKWYLFHDNPPVRASTNQRVTLRIIAPKLESDLPLRQLEGVARTFEKPAFAVWMRGLFGADIPVAAFEALQDDLRAGAVAMPQLALRSSVPGGHVAAYDSDTKEMLFSHSLVEGAVDESDADGLWQLVAALLEEFGHHVDNLLRNRYSSVAGDAPQDEGAKFAYALLNLSFHAQDNGEIGRLVYPFGPRALRGTWTPFTDAIKPWVDESQQTDEDRWRQYEFFGAGRGKEGKHNVGHSFGHQSIEDALVKAYDARQEQNYSEDNRREIYFGNWLRDFSQAIVPMMLGVFSREFITKLLDLKARQQFGDKPHFRVTQDVLGVYRTEDHLDNPYGLTDGTGADPDLNKACVAEQCAIDPDNWLQKHLRGRVPGCTSGFERIQHYLRRSMNSHGPERRRHFGAALHALEDFYAHSNFLEVTLIERGLRVYPWTAPFEVVRGGTRTAIYPVVTGCFGGVDTAASLSLEVGETLQKLFECKPGERSDATEIARLALRDWKPVWGARYEGFLKWREDWAKDFAWFDSMICHSIGALGAMMNYGIGGVVRLLANQIDEAQSAFLSDPTSYNPTHTQVAKDHDDHPLHELAAQCAKIAVREVGIAMSKAWAGEVPLAHVIELIASFMAHPAHIASTSPAYEVVTLIETWGRTNGAAVARLASTGWVEDASKSEEWREMRRRAEELSKFSERELAELQKSGAEDYARKKALQFGDVVQESLADARSQAESALESTRQKAVQTRDALTRENVEAALAAFGAVADAKVDALQGQAVHSFAEYEQRVRQAYAEVRRPDVRAQYEETARLAVERALQELHFWTQDKVDAINRGARKHAETVGSFGRDATDASTRRSKVDQVRAIIDAKVRSARDGAKSLGEELHQLVEDVHAEIEHPPPDTEFGALLRRELARQEAKLRAMSQAVNARMRKPVSSAEVHSFVRRQLSEVEALLHGILADALRGPELKDLERGSKQNVDATHDAARNWVNGVPDQAQKAAGDLKPKIVGTSESEGDDPQLQYARQLNPRTRGIESR